LNERQQGGQEIPANLGRKKAAETEPAGTNMDRLWKNLKKSGDLVRDGKNNLLVL
jgi:hypothetical protein